MILTQDQGDALSEIANISAGKAAKHLSMLLQDTVQMSVPMVVLEQVKQLPRLLDMSPDDLIVGVRQQISGALNAQATFLFRPLDGIPLAKALVGNEPSLLDIDLRALEHDAITEIGNIIVCSFLNTLAALLGLTMNISVPSYLEDILKGLIVVDGLNGDASSVYVLAVKVKLHALKRNVVGHLILVISNANLLTLLQTVDQWILNLQSEA